MSYEVRWRSDASRDVHAALDWYETEAPEQIARLAERLREAEQTIAQNPFLYRVLDGACRRYSLRTFPYEIWYRVLEEHKIVQILAFIHDRRDKMELADSRL